ncbi:MAG: hypothetical protein V1821_03640 [bacterium]
MAGIVNEVDCNRAVRDILKKCPPGGGFPNSSALLNVNRESGLADPEALIESSDRVGKGIGAGRLGRDYRDQVFEERNPSVKSSPIKIKINPAGENKAEEDYR